MARLRRTIVSDSESDLSDLATLATKARIQRAALQSSSKATPNNNAENDFMSTGEKAGNNATSSITSSSVKSASGKQRQSRFQRPLGPIQSNPLLQPLSNPKSKIGIWPSIDLPVSKSPEKVRQSPRKQTKSVQEYCVSDSESDFLEPSRVEDDSEDDLDNFIVSDSASEAELRRPARKPRSQTHLPSRRVNRRRIEDSETSDNDDISPSKASELVVLDSPQKSAADRRDRESDYSLFDKMTLKSAPEDFSDTPGTNLRFSPPTARPHRKKATQLEFVTPPTSPTKSRLVSPAKSRPRIPPTPHHPSIDAFWSQDVINDWNEQYSPQKEPKSTRDILGNRNDDRANSPSASLGKSPMKSPAKKDRKAIEQKKSFDAQKDSIAKSFLIDLDKMITGNQISVLAESTGGVNIKWSKTLNSTAGRANWKKETLRARAADGSCTTSYRHHASIELAEKVIDDEDRLLNVVAHEFCHLCNFMVSGIKDNPHGKEFKAWASKVTTAFNHRGIQVTTKHSYAISYKYIWSCVDCKQEYKRHSKSIDPKRHSCGGCKGKLEQIQPAPRGTSEKSQEYQKYVKANYGRVKDAMGEADKKGGMGKIMAQLAKEYKEMKLSLDITEKKSEKGSKLEVDIVDLDVRGIPQLVGMESDEERSMNGMAQKLQSIKL